MGREEEVRKFVKVITGEEYKRMSKRKLIDIRSEHPYKTIGDKDTYSEYNEGWNDAIDKVLDEFEDEFEDEYEPSKEEIIATLGDEEYHYRKENGRYE